MSRNIHICRAMDQDSSRWHIVCCF